MKIIQKINEMQVEAERLRQEGKKIGVVPTMGYLHEGHAALIRRARELADTVITTIFVNPAQFGPGEDLERYPRNFERDQKIASAAGTDIIFHPDAADMYPPGYQTYVEVEGVSKVLEGKFRPTHFRGVTTVVAKLLLATKPHVAVFGQKDAQQAYIVRRMVRDLNFDVDIVVAPIVREVDGLAMSSRNTYLTLDQRSKAKVLYESLTHAENLVRGGERSVSKIKQEMERIIQRAHEARIDYIAFVKPETFTEVEVIEPPEVLVALAVRFGATRLIDNIIVSVN
jgi:pantoate--beta-alanine ligase